MERAFNHVVVEIREDPYEQYLRTGGVTKMIINKKCCHHHPFQEGGVECKIEDIMQMILKHNNNITRPILRSCTDQKYAKDYWIQKHLDYHDIDEDRDDRTSKEKAWKESTEAFDDFIRGTVTYHVLFARIRELEEVIKTIKGYPGIFKEDWIAEVEHLDH